MTVQQLIQRRRDEILLFVNCHCNECGFGPTYDEIAEAVRCSRFTAMKDVKFWLDRGALQNWGRLVPRSIQPVGFQPPPERLAQIMGAALRQLVDAVGDSHKLAEAGPDLGGRIRSRARAGG